VQEDYGDETVRLRQEERWERAITVSVLAVIGSGILAFAANDALFVRPKHGDPRIACIQNLRAIEGAKATWALEHSKDTNAVPMDTDLFGDALYIREKPACPAKGAYTLGSIAQKPRCSIPGHTI